MLRQAPLNTAQLDALLRRSLPDVRGESGRWAAPTVELFAERPHRGSVGCNQNRALRIQVDASKSVEFVVPQRLPAPPSAHATLLRGRTD